MALSLKFKLTRALALLVCMTAFTVSAHAENPFGIPSSGGEERCLQCHQGIEEISRSHPLKLGCTSCHGGNAASEDKDQAHATLIHDPEAGTG